MVGVDEILNVSIHPLYSIVSQFEEDDLIVVKHDIDTDSIEGAISTPATSG